MGPPENKTGWTWGGGPRKGTEEALFSERELETYFIKRIEEKTYRQIGHELWFMTQRWGTDSSVNYRVTIARPATRPRRSGI